MNRINTSRVKRILLLVSAMMLMLLLCGCRTRITNNTEVSQTLTDDSGYMSETYQARRDELGIPVADAPLFDRGGSEEDEEYSDEYEDDEEYDEEYDEEDEEEDEDEEDEEEYDEEDEEDDDDDVSSVTPVRRPTVSSIRRPSTHYTSPHTSPQTATTVRVTLDVNAKDAKCSSSLLVVRKGSNYGSLPTPTRSGYTFEGWYTAKSKGKKITSTTKVNTDKAHTLYARWKEVKKKSYTITFDGNGEEDTVEISSEEITVTEGGTYGDMPSAKREKYNFKGWFTEAEGGSQVTSSTKFTANENQTLYAQWEHDPYKWWNDEYKKAVNEVTEESDQAYLIDADSDNKDKAESFLKDCKAHIADEETAPAYIIKFIKNYDEENAAKAVNEIGEKYSEIAPDATIIIVSNDAIYGEKAVKLLYRMKMFDFIYGSSYDMDEAEYDLLDGETAGFSTY